MVHWQHDLSSREQRSGRRYDLAIDLHLMIAGTSISIAPRDPTGGYLDGWMVCGFWKFDEQEAFSLSVTLPISYEGVF